MYALPCKPILLFPLQVLTGALTPTLLFAARYAVPLEASGPTAGVFRIFPAKVPTIQTRLL